MQTDKLIKLNSKITTTKFSRSGGYTLVELLLVVGLLAISVGVTSDILLSLIRSYSKTQVLNELEQQANFVGLKLEKEIRNADDAEIVPTSVGGENNIPTLKITPKGSSGTFICYRTRNITTNSPYIERTANGNATCSTGTWGRVTEPGIGNVKIECALAGPACFSVSTSTPKIVNIGIRFRQGQAGADTSFSGSVDIMNTIVIRETY